MLCVSMPNSSTSFLLVETATKCLATASSPSASVSQRRAAVALVSVSSVVKVFDATMKSVVAGSKSATFAIRSAGSTLETNRAEVRAADADVDDGADPLTGGAGPLAAAQPVGEIAHPVQHFVHIGDDVLPVDGQRCVARQPQRGVQHGPVFRDVDVRPVEHRVAVALEVGRAGEVDQQFQRVAVDAVFAVVDIEIADGEVEIAAAIGVFVEEITQMRLADLPVMLLQRTPCRGR